MRVLYRPLKEEAPDEVAFLESVEWATPHFSDLHSGDLVVPRYCTLPFRDWFYDQFAHANVTPINSRAQAKWAANIVEHTNVLGELTPQTWTMWYDLPSEMSFVVKGRTNSRKHQWNTHMFAETREDVPVVAGRLLDDGLISDQGLVVREYVPLRQFGEGINGLPVTNEWRTFWLSTPDGPVLLAKGYYWSSHPEYAEQAVWTDQAGVVAREAAELVSEHINFFVLDLAETNAGNWIVVEVNDGQQSGLSDIDPAELYEGLRSRLAG